MKLVEIILSSLPKACFIDFRKLLHKS